MGVIPRGTANAFSVALGIPTHIDDPLNFAVQAAEVILQVCCTGRQTGRQTIRAKGCWSTAQCCRRTLPATRHVRMSPLSISAMTRCTHSQA